MNVSEQAQRAYAPTQVQIQTPRSVESKLLAQITSELQQFDGKDGSFGKLVEAVHRNRELWILLATDVAGPDNGLPDVLRAQVFYLAEFTEQYSQKILRQEASTDALVEINTAVLRGLNSRGMN